MTNDYQSERQGASRRCGHDSQTPTKRPESISSSFANRHTCERNGVSHRYSYWLDVTGETPAASALPLTGLGGAFAFVGRQYRLDVSDRDYYLDLLFYHLSLRCFVVMDLKKDEFKPEYAGKMNFYCSVVGDQLRHPQDQPTLLGEPQGASRGFFHAEGHSIPAASALPLTGLPEGLASSLPSIEAIEAELSLDLDREATDE